MYQSDLVRGGFFNSLANHCNRLITGSEISADIDEAVSADFVDAGSARSQYCNERPQRQGALGELGRRQWLEMDCQCHEEAHAASRRAGRAKGHCGAAWFFSPGYLVGKVRPPDSSP